MFDRYYCMKSFCHLKTWEKRFEKFFLYYYNGAQKHEGFEGFRNACSRAKTYVILTSLNNVHFYARYCWWRQCLRRPRMRICKVQKPCINRTWIAWLIHGFLPVKTWLLIACDTAFYAIMYIWYSICFKSRSLYHVTCCSQKILKPCKCVEKTVYQSRKKWRLLQYFSK